MVSVSSWQVMCMNVSASWQEYNTAVQEGLKVPWLLSNSSSLQVGTEPSLSALQLLRCACSWRQVILVLSCLTAQHNIHMLNTSLKVHAVNLNWLVFILREKLMKIWNFSLKYVFHKILPLRCTFWQIDDSLVKDRPVNFVSLVLPVWLISWKGSSLKPLMCQVWCQTLHLLFYFILRVWF